MEIIQISIKHLKSALRLRWRWSNRSSIKTTFYYFYGRHNFRIISGFVLVNNFGAIKLLAKHLICAIYAIQREFHERGAIQGRARYKDYFIAKIFICKGGRNIIYIIMHIMYELCLFPLIS